MASPKGSITANRIEGKPIKAVRKRIAQTVFHLQMILDLPPADITLVTGCPRSGTSALISWLHGHKDVAAFFESRTLVSAHCFCSEVDRCQSLHDDQNLFFGQIRRTAMKYYQSKKLLVGKHLIDKEPLEPIAFPHHDYAQFLKNTRRLFPDIKYLFMVREPLETIWSMMNRKWGYSLTSHELRSFSLEECIQNWNDCSELALEYANDKNVFICRYDRLVQKPVETSRDVLKFIGLKPMPPFQPRPTKTVDFNESDTALILWETSDHMAAVESLCAA